MRGTAQSFLLHVCMLLFIVSRSFWSLRVVYINGFDFNANTIVGVQVFGCGRFYVNQRDRGKVTETSLPIQLSKAWLETRASQYIQ
jgi:hypothetical protein